MSKLLIRTEWDTESNFSVASSAHPTGPSKRQQHGFGIGRCQEVPTTSASTFQVSALHGNPDPSPPARQKFSADRGQNLSTVSVPASQVSTARNNPAAEAIPRLQGPQGYNRGISLGHHAGNTSAFGMIIYIFSLCLISLPPGPAAAHTHNPSQDQIHQRQENTYNLAYSRKGSGPFGNSQRFTATVKPRTSWAKCSKLVTTRKGILNQKTALEEAEMQRYRSRPKSNEEFMATVVSPATLV